MDKILNNQDTNYVIGLIVALLSASILQGNISTSFFSNNLIIRALFLIGVVYVAFKNIVLGSILGFLFVILHLNTSINEAFANIGDSDEDPDYNHEDDSYDEKSDMDDEQKKQYEKDNKEKELNENDDGEVSKVIGADESDDNSQVNKNNSNNDNSQVNKNNENNQDNNCLIKCLQKNYTVDKCQVICDEICDCGTAPSSNQNKQNSMNNLDLDDKARNNYKKLQQIMEDSMDQIPEDIKNKYDEDIV